MSTLLHKIESNSHTATQNLSDWSPDAVSALAEVYAGEVYGGDPKNIAAVKLLDGRIFAMLTPKEEVLLNVYRQQGCKWGVSVSIVNEGDPVAYAAAKSRHEADHIMKSANSLISVTVQ